MSNSIVIQIDDEDFSDVRLTVSGTVLEITLGCRLRGQFVPMVPLSIDAPEVLRLFDGVAWDLVTLVELIDSMEFEIVVEEDESGLEEADLEEFQVVEHLEAQLAALVAIGYLEQRGGEYVVTDLAREWLDENS
jgi:hypothetical protein